MRVVLLGRDVSFCLRARQNIVSSQAPRRIRNTRKHIPPAEHFPNASGFSLHAHERNRLCTMLLEQLEPLHIAAVSVSMITTQPDVPPQRSMHIHVSEF